jgi:hypothetical protein
LGGNELKLYRSLTWGTLIAALLVCGANTASAQTGYGRINGIVSDPAGVPQMGATVWLSSEVLGSNASSQLFTDQNGTFSVANLRPGLYHARVTLAGFLPAMQEHIRVSANLTTIVRLELGSVFASLEALRRLPPRPTESDDWQWVLRTSAATRPTLRLLEDDEATVTLASGAAEEGVPERPRARLEMTSGSHHPGSSSGLPGPSATAASYDQSLGAAGRLLVAGRMSYAPESGAGATFSSVWLPSGEIGRGPETVVVLRQARFAQTGQTFRSLRAAHSERMHIVGVDVDYGAAYVVAEAGSRTYRVNPRVRVSAKLSPEWVVTYALESEPDAYGLRNRGALESAVAALDTLPVIIWSGGKASIAGGWHHEISATRVLGPRRTIELAAFRDSSNQVAVFGFDLADANGVNEPPIAAYAHDGGAGKSWGTRLVYREKIFEGWEVAGIYACAGVLVPFPRSIGDESGATLAESLETAMRHSVAARISGKVPGVQTKFSASYKWLSGVAVSRQDVFGEAALGIDPNLSLTVRQPLPSFGASGRLEALADFRNVLSQGGVSVDASEGKLLLNPVMRSFRGGVSYQF